MIQDTGAYEYIPLTVTVEQAVGQSNPTNGSTINLTVVFSESVSDFATGDVSLSGTAGATTATVTGSGTTYNIAVTGMTNSGTVIASIDVDKATGATGNTNDASTSTDNSVTYDITNPVISAIASTPSSTDATITWTTDEDSSSKVDYGLTDSYGSSTTETDISTRVQSHSVALSGLTTCTTYHYRVRSTDSLANEAVDTDNTFITAGCTTSNSSNSSSSTTSTDTPSCSDQAPGAKAPWLYGAIAQDSGSVLLYFTEADNPVNKYVLEYGTKSGDYPYGVQDMGVNSRGQMTFLVKSLSSNTTYYFKVRGGNGCAVGNWSNEISAKTKGLVSFNQLDITQSELVTKPVEEASKTIEVPAQAGYDVKIKVVDKNKKPVEGAKVTIHSKVQETVTNKDGIAEFKNVEKGEHKVLIAYNNFEGQQTVNLTGNVKEFDLNVTVQQKAISLSPLAYGIIGVMTVVIIGLVYKSKIKS